MYHVSEFEVFDEQAAQDVGSRGRSQPTRRGLEVVGERRQKSTILIGPNIRKRSIYVIDLRFPLMTDASRDYHVRQSYGYLAMQNGF